MFVGDRQWLCLMTCSGWAKRCHSLQKPQPTRVRVRRSISDTPWQKGKASRTHLIKRGPSSRLNRESNTMSSMWLRPIAPLLCMVGGGLSSLWVSLLTTLRRNLAQKHSTLLVGQLRDGGSGILKISTRQACSKLEHSDDKRCQYP